MLMRDYAVHADYAHMCEYADVDAGENLIHIIHIQGVFLTALPPKKLKYVKPRLGESTLTYIVLDTPNLA